MKKILVYWDWFNRFWEKRLPDLKILYTPLNEGRYEKIVESSDTYTNSTFDAKHGQYQQNIGARHKCWHVPEDLNVHMNEIYKNLTTIKLNKFEFKKIF